MTEAEPGAEARGDDWLLERYMRVRDTYFHDLPPGLPIHIAFGRAARRRFGSIAERGGICRITINGLFRAPDIPAYVIDATIAHELCHYVHGYGSGLPRLHSHPHQGGVIDAEMIRRGCYILEEHSEAWRACHWADVVARTPELTVPRAISALRTSAIWDHYLARPGFRSRADLDALAARTAARFGLPEAPFRVDWLRASVRVHTLSYFRPGEKCVLVHGLLADPAVPASVMQMEVAYWVAAHVVGNHGDAVAQAIESRGMGAAMRRALRWRSTRWARWLPAHHPLRV